MSLPTSVNHKNQEHFINVDNLNENIMRRLKTYENMLININPKHGELLPFRHFW